MKFKKRSLLLGLITLFTLMSCNVTSSSDSTSIEDSSSEIVSSEEIEYQRVNYTNPLRILKKDGTPYFVPIADPDIIRGDDGYFYMYPTNCEVEMGDKGMQFDLGPIFRSKDMINWTWVASVFDGHTDAINWGTPGAGVWAPSIIKVGSRYNYYYSLSTWGDSNPGVGVATSPTPYGPWTHYGRVIDSVTTGVKNSIDPFAIYENETLYLIWGSFFGIAAIELTDDGLEPFYGEYVKEYLTWIIPDNSGGKMDINKNYEGSYIIKENGYYYYFGSQGTCCSGVNSTYTVKVGKSTSLFGPYLDAEGNDMISGKFGETVVGPSEQVAGVGHNSVIQDYNGDWWLVYHGFDINGERPNERVLFIDKLLWDENGYPYVENKVASYQKVKEGPLTIK